jgi:hypothetical protein
MSQMLVRTIHWVTPPYRSNYTDIVHVRVRG